MSKSWNQIKFFYLYPPMPQPEQLYGLTWLGQQWNEERTDRQTGTFTERLRSNGPCAMMERHQQPGNSVHLLYTTERGGRFIVYSWMKRKNARRCWWIMGSSTEASETHWGQPVCDSAGVSARRGLCEAKRPLRGHCMRFWKWSLGYSGDRKMLDMAEV